MTGFFPPKSSWGLSVRNLATNLSSKPFLGQVFLGAALRDDFRLPEHPG